MFLYVTAALGDYGDSSIRQYVYFNNTDTRKCYNITILPDSICEVDFANISSEIFYSILSTSASQVKIEQPRAIVSINDDREAECGKLKCETQCID